MEKPDYKMSVLVQRIVSIMFLDLQGPEGWKNNRGLTSPLQSTNSTSKTSKVQSFHLTVYALIRVYNANSTVLAPDCNENVILKSWIFKNLPSKAQ